MRAKRNIFIILAALFLWGTVPQGEVTAQDVRTLTVGSLRLSAGESPWLGSLNRTKGFDLNSSLYGGLTLDSVSFLPEISSPDDLFLSELESKGLDSSRFNLKQRIGRVFNLSLALSNIKTAKASSSSNVRSMTGAVGPETDQGGSVQGDLWALDLGLEYRDPSGHGLHLGYLHGTDPLTREADLNRPDKQGVDLGYSYDLDGFYVNLGYVYSFSQLWTGDREESSDSAFYLRFQLHF